MSEQLEDKKMNTYASGMIREDKSKKVMFDLIFPEKQKLENTLIYRFANHLTKGASVHGDRNWEKASGVKELEDFKRGAWRHVIQFLTGQTDEDHAAATLFNINGMVYLMDKLNCDIHGKQNDNHNEPKTSFSEIDDEPETSFFDIHKEKIFKKLMSENGGRVIFPSEFKIISNGRVDKFECYRVFHNNVLTSTVLCNETEFFTS